MTDEPTPVHQLRLACAQWPGLLNPSGYGILPGKRLPSRNGKSRNSIFVHRAVYLFIHGWYPPWLEIDHTCHNTDTDCPGGSRCLHRQCYEITHLEAITHAENGRRAGARFTLCVNGHERSPGESCRACHRESERIRYYQRKGRPVPPLGWTGSTGRPREYA